MSIFNHGLSPEFISQLAEEANKDSWWADVLNDPKLFVAIRHNYLNVYWRGQSLFCVSNPSGLKVTTHQKYLVDPALASQVPLKTDGSFDVESIIKHGVISRYEGPKTLAKMKKAAGLFSKLEKTGCHEIAVNNPAVIDFEIAFGGTVSSGDDGDKKGAPRADLASIERGKGENARLVFWEAKHYSNGELRADDGLAPVCAQVKIYQNYLRDNRGAVEESYTRVAANLVDISNMRLGRPLSPLIAEVVARKGRLTLGDEPKVGLIIFGFDAGQRDHPGWKKHLKVLEENISPVVAVGDANGIRLKS